MTAAFTYKALLTHQRCDQLAESDKVFNDLLTEITDLDNIRHNNAKGPKGEVAAGGSYKKLILLDSGNVVQLGESGTEVRVPADPTNALGVATKQYADGVNLLQTQPRVSVTSGASGSYVTILNATAKGHVRCLYIRAISTGGGNDIMSIRITIDGGTPVVYADAGNTAASDISAMTPDLILQDTNALVSVNAHAILIDIAFNTSMLIEAQTAETTGDICVCVYDKVV